MDIVTDTSTVTATTSTTETSATGIEADYETFLKMLTVQLQNQDPLNPVDASDYAAQLAQFSAVEQQVQTNDLLSSIDARLAAADFTNLANWVGKEVLSESAALYSGESISISPEFDSLAEQTDLVVLDESGNEVYRQQISSTESEVVWDGSTNSGEATVGNLYQFYTEGFSNEDSLGAQVAQSYSLVREARWSDDAVTLVLEGGVSVLSTDVSALREEG